MQIIIILNSQESDQYLFSPIVYFLPTLSCGADKWYKWIHFPWWGVGGGGRICTFKSDGDRKKGVQVKPWSNTPENTHGSKLRLKNTQY